MRLRRLVPAELAKAALLVLPRGPPEGWRPPLLEPAAASDARDRRGPPEPPPPPEPNRSAYDARLEDMLPACYAGTPPCRELGGKLQRVSCAECKTRAAESETQQRTPRPDERSQYARQVVVHVVSWLRVLSNDAAWHGPDSAPSFLVMCCCVGHGGVDQTPLKITKYLSVVRTFSIQPSCFNCKITKCFPPTRSRA